MTADPERADAAADAARQLAAVLRAVESGELQATRGQRDRLRGASVALTAIADADTKPAAPA